MREFPICFKSIPFPIFYGWILILVRIQLQLWHLYWMFRASDSRSWLEEGSLAHGLAHSLATAPSTPSSASTLRPRAWPRFLQWRSLAARQDPLLSSKLLLPLLAIYSNNFKYLSDSDMYQTIAFSLHCMSNCLLNFLLLAFLPSKI